MAYTYNDFLKAAGAAGMLKTFDQKDLDTAKRNPEFGLSLLSLRKDAANATTPEQKLLATETENQLRKSYGGYTIKDGTVTASSFGYDKAEDPAFQTYEQIYKQAGDKAEDTVLQKVGVMSAGRTPDYLKGVADHAATYYRAQLGDAVPSLEQAAYQRYLNDKVLRETEKELGEPVQLFNYDPSTDPGWAAYRSAYMREMEREIENTLAREAAATGGRASSYAVTAALQGASDNAQQMAGGVNALEQNAYSRYLSERVKALEEKEAEKLTALAGTAQGGYRGTAGHNNGSLSEIDVKTLQATLGVDQDGKFGPASQAAAGGLRADEAYDFFVRFPYETWGSVNVDWQSLWNLGYPASYDAAYVKSLINSGNVTKTIDKNGRITFTGAGAPGDVVYDLGNLQDLGYSMDLTPEELFEAEQNGEIVRVQNGNVISFTKPGGTTRVMRPGGPGARPAHEFNSFK